MDAAVLVSIVRQTVPDVCISVESVWAALVLRCFTARISILRAFIRAKTGPESAAVVNLGLSITMDISSVSESVHSERTVAVADRESHCSESDETCSDAVRDVRQPAISMAMNMRAEVLTICAMDLRVGRGRIRLLRRSMDIPLPQIRGDHGLLPEKIVSTWFQSVAQAHDVVPECVYR